MEGECREQNSLGFVGVSSDKLGTGVTSGMVDALVLDIYEIRPRKKGDGFDLISDRLRRGPIWYAGPDAVRNAVAYAKYRSRSRSHGAIIRVLDQSGIVIETHQSRGDLVIARHKLPESGAARWPWSSQSN
jgi:hypothetical protein